MATRPEKPNWPGPFPGSGPLFWMNVLEYPSRFTRLWICFTVELEKSYRIDGHDPKACNNGRHVYREQSASSNRLLGYFISR